MAKCGETIWGNKDKYLKFYNGDLVGINGGTIEYKLTLNDLRVPYTQLYVNQIVLKPEQSDVPINFTDATFIGIAVRYDIKSVNEEDNYIEYYYADAPDKIRYIAQFMLLTTNSKHKIGPIYISNPSKDYSVRIEVMVGNIDDTYSYYNVNENIATFIPNLKFTQFATHVLGESLFIYSENNINNKLAVFSINGANYTINGNKIFIQTNINELTLSFINEENAKQALSALLAVDRNPNLLIETLVSNGGDTIPPNVEFSNLVEQFVNNTSNGYGPWSSNDDTTINDYRGTISLTEGTNLVIGKEHIRAKFIVNIIDDRDDFSLNDNSSLKFYNPDNIEIFYTNLPGDYLVKFNASDVAGNYIREELELKITITV